MVLKRLISATACIALMATPVIATAAPSANGRVDTAVAPAAEKVEGARALGGKGNIFIIGAAVVAVALGIYFALKNHDHDLPASP